MATARNDQCHLWRRMNDSDGQDISSQAFVEVAVVNMVVVACLLLFMMTHHVES